MQELKAQIDKVQASIKKEVALARRQVRDEYVGSHRMEELLHRFSADSPPRAGGLSSAAKCKLQAES